MAGRLGTVHRLLQTLFESGAIGGLADGELLDVFITRGDGSAAEAAFAGLVERHGPAVLRVCRGILGDEHAAEDAFQATFLVLARRARSVRKADSVASWLFGVARRVATKARADAARRRDKERRGAEMSARRTDPRGHAEACPELYEELDRLPEKYRAPLILCYFTGLTYGQAAERLNCPVRTLQTRLIRGRERLRGMLIRRGLTPMVGLLGVLLSEEAAQASVPASLVETTARAALPFSAGQAAGIASSVLSLAEGTLKTMLYSKLKLGAAALTVCVAAAAGVVVVSGMLPAQVAPRPAVAPPPPRRATFQGRWSVTMPGPDGQVQTLTWRVEGETVLIQAIPPGGAAQEIVKGKLEINEEARPRTLAIRDATGPDGRPQQENLGIYQIDGDTLTVCYGMPGQPRPKEFKGGEDGPPFLMTLKRGGPEAGPAPAQRAALPTDPVEVVGRVLDPDGRPYAGAKIHFFRPDDARPGEEPRAADPGEGEVSATSGADGRFSFVVSATDFAGITSAFPFSLPTVSAVAQGFGPGWSSLRSPASARGLTLKLAKDDVPVDGRVLDLEGRPVAGANVRVLGVLATRGDDPGPVLRAFRASPAAAGVFPFFEKRLDRSASGLPASLRTAADGRFRLTGAGRGRVVELRIEGPGIATQKWVDVLTNPNPLADAREAIKRPEPEITFSANPTFEILAGPSQPVVGVVRDKDTGKPIPGVVVKSEKLAQIEVLANDFVRTTTDGEGRYRLVGLPKGPGHTIQAIPADGQPYLASVVEVGSAPGVDPVTADIALKRGVLIRGRVTDGKDGNPVRARVEYFAEFSNPRVNDAPGFTGAHHAVPTRPDGSFAIAVLPGRGMLAVRAEGDRFPTADKVGNPKPTQLVIQASPYFLQRVQYHAIIEVAPRPDEREIMRDIVLGTEAKTPASTPGGGRRER